MKHHKLKSLFLLLTMFAMLVFSCQDKPEKKSNEGATGVPNLEELSKLDTIKITLNSNDKMQFDMAEINVFEGQTVMLTLHHTGTMPLKAMGHNFVLLTQGTAISDFAKDALKAKDNQYIPKDGKSVIAYTDLIGGGETTSVTFKAPEKGIYDFLCSFPGHYAIMKGKFNVN